MSKEAGDAVGIFEPSLTTRNELRKSQSSAKPRNIFRGKGIYLLAAMFLGCVAVSTGKSTSPPPTTAVYFFAPPNTVTYMRMSGGVFQNGSQYVPAQRRPDWDDYPRYDGCDQTWVAYGLEFTLYNGEQYSADYTSDTGIYYGTANWTQDNDTRILCKP
jgi:hypothetical protein